MGALALNLFAGPGCAVSLGGRSKYLQPAVGPASRALHLVPTMCRGSVAGPGAVGRQ